MKTRILLILLVLSSVTCSAQTQILFQNNQTKSFLLSYSSATEESQQVINEMLNAIATYIPKPAYQTNITFNISESIKITRDRNSVSIYVAYQNIIISGDVFYKGFDMTDVLVPAKYEFAGTLSRGRGTPLADFTQPKISFTPPFSEVILQYTDTVPSTTYTFVISSVKFYYDNTARIRFRDKVGLIDQYFLADADLNKINDQLNSINPDAFESIERTQESLNTINTGISNIAGAVFWQALNIPSFDPLRLNIKMNDVINRHKELQTQVNYTKSVIHQLYYDKALFLYNNNKTSEAKDAFEKSMYYAPMYAPSQYFLARIAFETNKTEEAKTQIKKLFSFKNIDDNTRKAAIELVSKIEWYDMNIAAGLLNQGKYSDALAAVDKAEVFCNSIPAYTCNDTIRLIRTDCHNGIYANYLKSADNLFAQKKLDEAENEIEKAIDYQKQFSQYILNNQAAIDIKQKIKIEQYYAAMKKGKEEMDIKNYRAAFFQFNKASAIEALYPVKKDKQLPELLKKSKLEVLLLDIDDANKAVTANDLTKAREILIQVIDAQKFYGLLDNSKLSVKIESLKKAIFSQECMNAQKDYDAKIAAASISISEKNFIAAETSYSEALQTVDKFRDCGINTDLAIAGKKNVEKPAQYQRTFAQCNDLANSRNYSGAIDAYNKLTIFYNSNNIGNSGISHQPLHLYIATFESGFVLFGVTWHINTGDIDNGFYLLKQLRQRNYKKALTKNQQIGLARGFAIRDFKANSTLNAKLKVAEYTVGDKWYSYFTKEYQKQIKKFQ